MNVKCGFERSSVFEVWEVDSSGEVVVGGGGFWGEIFPATTLTKNQTPKLTQNPNSQFPNIDPNPKPKPINHK